MNTISIIATVLAGYLFFCYVNNSVLLYFNGFNNNVTKQRYMEQLWLSDLLYPAHNSICYYKYANKINFDSALVVIFVPLFNIVWLVVSIYKLLKYNRHKLL